MLFKCPDCGTRYWKPSSKWRCFLRHHEDAKRRAAEFDDISRRARAPRNLMSESTSRPYQASRQDSDYLSDPLHPLNPMNPLNPASPLWNDSTAADTHTRDHCYDSTPSTSSFDSSYSYDSGSSSDSGCSSSSD